MSLERRWLRVKEFAELVGCHPVTVRKLIRRRAVPFVKRKGIGVRVDFKKFEEEMERTEILPQKRGRR